MDEQINQGNNITIRTQSDSDSTRTIKIFCHKCQQKLDVTGIEPFSKIECPVCNEMLIIPKWFGQYLLEEPCGIGGMSNVYRALDVTLDREVAIKILNEEILPESERSNIFLNEARTTATINHYSVIPIYTCGIYEKQTYIVMQFMRGGTLETKLELSEEPLPCEDVAQWIHDVAEGLESAMRHGIVHHDIKPANIMLDEDGNAKIGDFGIAQSLLEAADNAVNSTTDTWVSPLYVSPEKISTGKETQAGDIYSLGATFYHLLTGVPPFMHEHLEELIWCRTRENPKPPIQLRHDIPPVLNALIISMMHRYPEQRPSYTEIIKVLSSYLNNTDTVPIALLRDIPLPELSGSEKRITAAAYKVKSPSALLKKRRSAIHPAEPHIKLNQQRSDARPISSVQTMNVEDFQLPPQQQKHEKLIKTILFLLALGILFFLGFAIAQLLQSMDTPRLPKPEEMQVRLTPDGSSKVRPHTEY
ncbi:MAG: serine/threonine protein kinase [Lentisphaeria bacterium]|nr:serine/threonine protein kinase [Lentisphaeria bacterium]